MSIYRGIKNLDVGKRQLPSLYANFIRKNLPTQEADFFQVQSYITNKFIMWAITGEPTVVETKPYLFHSLMIQKSRGCHSV